MLVGLDCLKKKKSKHISVKKNLQQSKQHPFRTNYLRSGSSWLCHLSRVGWAAGCDGSTPVGQRQLMGWQPQELSRAES